MRRLLVKLPTAGRLWLGAGAVAACLMAVSLNSLRVLKARVTEERKAQIHATVDTVHSLLVRYGALVEAGEMSREQAQQVALQTVRGLRYGEREYFWINDLQARMVMHPVMPDLEGKNLGTHADPSGKRLFAEFVRTVQTEPTGEGFVTYRWPRPGGTEPVRKLSFVKLYAPWQWIVGSGIYLDDMDAALSGEARRVLGATTLLALLLGAAGIAVARNLKRARDLEVKERRAQANARRYQRALRTLSKCNEAVVRAVDERALVEAVCGAIVEVGGYQLSWVGFMDRDDGKAVRPIAQVGQAAGPLCRTEVVRNEAGLGRGPVGEAIRTGKAVIARDVSSDPDPAQQRAAERSGCTSLAALPLVAEGATIGALVICSAEADGFDGDEMGLLAELADDLAFGVVALRGRAERAKMTAQLIQADRLVAMGTLAAGVAHEINNPLAFVLGGLEFVTRQARGLSKELPPGRLNEMEQVLAEMHEGGTRIRQAVRDLKTFSRSDEAASGPVDVRRLLDASVKIAFNEIRHRAKLVKDYGPVPLINANQARLGQVFLNLLINASQAIPEGDTSSHEIRLVTRADSAGRAVVEIHDTGSGIAPEIREHIFEPFFTTKPNGVGTGLGLPICRSVVAAMGGEIAVESEPGRGSTFSVYLPPLPAEAKPSEAIPSPPVPGRRGRILAVDDELLVGSALRRTLPEHEVVTETTVKGALDRIAAGEHFDLVICDLMMPEKSGMDFHAEVAASTPELARRIVFLSGGPFTPKARAFLDRVQNPFVEKPFDTRALRDLVNGMLR